MHKPMRLYWLLLPLLLAFGHTARAEEEAKPPSAVTAQRRDAAIARAFKYLDRYLDVAVISKWAKRNHSSVNQIQARRVAAAVAAWSYLLADGGEGAKLPGRAGPLRAIRTELLRFMKALEQTYEAYRTWTEDPTTEHEVAARSATSRQLIWGHGTWVLGPAAFFFAERHARSKATRESSAELQQARRLLELCQQKDGGWGDEHHGLKQLNFNWSTDPSSPRFQRPTAIAPTNCAAPALATATRILGLERPKSVDRALHFYRALARSSGGFPASQWDSHTGIDAQVVARTSASLFALLSLGVAREDMMFKRSTRLVDRRMEWVSESQGSATWGLLTSALGARARGAKEWGSFRREVFPRLLDGQSKNGGLPCICARSPRTDCDSDPLRVSAKRPGGGILGKSESDALVYTTAINAFILILDRARPLTLPPEPEKVVTTGK